MLPLIAGIGLLGYLLFLALGILVWAAMVAAAAWIVKLVWRRPAGDELVRLRALVLAMYEQSERIYGGKLAPVEYAAVRQDLVKEL